MLKYFTANKKLQTMTTLKTLTRDQFQLVRMRQVYKTVKELMKEIHSY